MEITIEQLKTFTPDLTETINGLLAQSDFNARILRDEDVKEVIESQSNSFFVAKDGNRIVGMITLIIYRIPVWKKGWIEDVVVDEKYRGKGIATKLINMAIEHAQVNGVLSLNLTSSSEKENANRLYIKLGFEKRDTNVYRIKL
jgi:ribosomal protein S18 acetylase RimI-like enzyme